MTTIFPKSNDTDDLGLTKMTIPNIPSDILFPEELNQYLQGQIQFLTHSNGMLQKIVSEKESLLNENEQIIKELNTKLMEYEKLTSGNSSHLLSAKLVELSKRLREKTAENESLKTKLSKREQQLRTLNNKSEPELIPEPKLESESETRSEIENKTDEIKILQEKLLQTNNKFFDVKNANCQLKNELKLANKILQQELGDGFTSIQNLGNSGLNWRGRAQQILNLQQKNAELQEKLSISGLIKLDSNTTINSRNDNRKQQIEQLQKELTNVKTELEETKKKLNGSRARIKVLETECYNLKSKLNTAQEKSSHDEQMIRMITNQVSTMEEAQNEIKKEKQFYLQRLQDENKNLKLDIIKEKTTVENLKNSVADKEQRIKDLLNEMQTNQNTSSFHNSRPSSFNNKESNRIQILEVEVNRLLELVSVLNNRLESDREIHSEIQFNYQKERKRAAKLETKLSRLELENSMNNKSQICYSRSFSKTSVNEENNQICIENLKNSLELAEENATLFKSRLDILQKEKDLDLQRFKTILSETSDMMKMYFNTTAN